MYNRSILDYLGVTLVVLVLGFLVIMVFSACGEAPPPTQPTSIVECELVGTLLQKDEVSAPILLMRCIDHEGVQVVLQATEVQGAL